MTVTTHATNLRQYKSSFSLIEKLILPFASSPNMVKEVKNLPSNVKLITSQGMTLLILNRSMFPSYRNQSVDLQRKSTDWFLYDGNIG